MKWMCLCAVLALLGAAGCGSKSAEPSANGTPNAVANPAVPAGTTSAMPVYNLGDVEFMTRVVVQVAQKSLTPAVEYQELGTLREKVTVANANVKGPRPQEFWITSLVESRQSYRAQDAIFLKAEVKADGATEPLAVNTYLVSGADLHRKPQTVDINLMEKLNPVPDSVLIQTHVTLVWFPDTSVMSVDATNPDFSKGQVQEIRSNTLRINFE